MNASVFNTYVLRSFLGACGIKDGTVDSRTISSKRSSYSFQIDDRVRKLNNSGEIDITDKEKFCFKWIYHPWAMRDGITFDIRPIVNTRVYERWYSGFSYEHDRQELQNLDGDLTLIAKHRGNEDISRLMIINGTWKNGLLTDDNAQIIYFHDNFKRQYVLIGTFKNNIFIKGTIYSYCLNGNSMLCRHVPQNNDQVSKNSTEMVLQQNESNNQNSKTTQIERLKKNFPVKYEYDSNYNNNFGGYCGKRTGKRRCKEKCVIGDCEISSLLLQDEIAFIKTTIVPNILEIEGYSQVNVPGHWQFATDRDSLRFDSYRCMVQFFSHLVMDFVESDENGLINTKMIKYAPQNDMKQNENRKKTENSNKYKNASGDRKIEMEVRGVPGEKGDMFCRIIVEQLTFVPAGNETSLQEKTESCSNDELEDKYQEMKNGIIEYYCSFNHLSRNYASWLIDNSKYIGYVGSSAPLYDKCSFDGYGEIYTKNSNDEYTLACKCTFRDNKGLISSIIDSSYRQTVANFIQCENGNHSNLKCKLNDDIMFSNRKFYTRYVEKELQTRIIDQINHIVKYQRKMKNINEIAKIIDDKSGMYNVWIPIMNVSNETENASNVANIKLNFLKSICKQIENLIQYDKNEKNQHYVPFSRISHTSESQIIKVCSCGNNYS